MADVRLDIANREYIVTCRDGEEEHLRKLGAVVAEMVQEASGTAGGLNESRQLLFASLLLADKLQEGPPAAPSGATTPSGKQTEDSASGDAAMEQAAITLEKMAGRLEQFTDKLEK